VDAYIAGRQIPHCQLLVEFTGSDEHIRLRCRVDLQGARSPNHFFMITRTAEHGSKLPTGMQDVKFCRQLLPVAFIGKLWLDIHV